MFYSITGKVIHTDAASVVLETGGIGYRLTVSGRTLGYAADGASKGDVRLYTYLSVREDGIELFGFRDERELDLYKKLISVSGVGPKMGIAILSALSPEEIAFAVGGGDYKPLTRAQGVGKRTAERIILELRDKLGALPESTPRGRCVTALACRHLGLRCPGITEPVERGMPSGIPEQTSMFDGEE